MLKLFAALPLAFAGIPAGAEPIPIRAPIGSFAVAPAKAVSRVEMTRVDFLPGQEMPEHLHPVPVVCVVSKGSFAASIGREPERRVTVGETTIEPAGEVVHYFRNLSKRDPAQLYCAILAGPDDKQLSVMLNK
jgi:quercetin dioxygenase-like cupin family protein